MSAIDVHPRIAQRHPEVTPEDVIEAMRGMVRYQQRPSGEWAAVGFDGKGRLVELVYVYNEELDSFLVYHAFTPPTGKMMKELGLERR